jgi:hypothetical protein
VAGVAAPLMIEHHAQARLREQHSVLGQQAGHIAGLTAQNEQLSNLLANVQTAPTRSNGRLDEVLKLRSEIGHLQTAVRQLTAAKTNALSRDEALASLRQLYADRVNRLKQSFAENPGQSVPELQYLTDRKWLDAVEYDHHQIDPDNSRAMSSVRGTAQIGFVDGPLFTALQQYGKDNNGQFPTDVSQLAPYFKSPVDNSVLQDWAVLPTSSLPAGMQIDEDWAITQKAPINAALDQRVVIGLKSSRLGSGHNQWSVTP